MVFAVVLLTPLATLVEHTATCILLGIMHDRLFSYMPSESLILETFSMERK